VRYFLFCWMALVLSGCSYEYNAGWREAWGKCSAFWEEAAASDLKMNEGMDAMYFKMGCTSVYEDICHGNRHCMGNGFRKCIARQEKMESRRHQH
jgi:hypothetical protein